MTVAPDGSGEPDPATLGGFGPGMRVLDAACGRGDRAQGLLDAGASVVLLDRSADRLAEVPPGLAARAPRVRGNVFALPFPAGSFDGVLLRAVVHHLPEPLGAIAECARVLRPGGTLVLVDHDAPEAPAALALRNAVERLRHPGHAWSHSVEGLSVLGTGARLEVDRVVRWSEEVELGAWLRAARTPEPFARWAEIMVRADAAVGGPAMGAHFGGSASAEEDEGVTLTRRWASIRLRKPERGSP